MDKQKIIDKTRSIINLVKSSKIRSISALLVILLAIPFTVYLVRQIAKYKTGATVDMTNIYFSPQTANVGANQEQSFYLMSDFGNNNVSFIRATLTYDPTLITFTNFTPSDTISDIIELTPLNNANSHGSLTIVYAIPPDVTSLTNIIQVARFTVTAQTTQENVSTSISINSNDSQFVDNTETATPIISSPLNLVLNYVAPSNTMTQTPIPTQTVTQGQTSTPTPTTFSGFTPTPLTNKGTCECKGSKVKINNCTNGYTPTCINNNNCSCI